MDADNTPVPRSSPTMGGTVEHAKPAPETRTRRQASPDKAGERFELRDPFAEVTYRANSLQEMTAKADQLGSTRFVAVAEDGKRTAIQKTDGEWRRGRQLPALRERPLDPGPAHDEAPRAADVVPLPGAARLAAKREQIDTEPIAKVDPKAERAALVARIEAALMERYVIKRAPVTVGDVSLGQTEYRFRGDSSRVAFTESTFKLATDTNSPSVARSMVDVAETRGWKALRISGHEDFRRMVWLEASVRGVKALGYEPNPADLEVLKREREARLTNRIEPARDASGTAAATPADKPSARGSGGRKAVLAAIEAVLVARNVPEKQRAAVMTAATEKLAQRIRDGETPKVKVYDKSAPSHRSTVVPTPEQKRSRERATPAPAR